MNHNFVIFLLLAALCQIALCEKNGCVFSDSSKCANDRTFIRTLSCSSEDSDSQSCNICCDEPLDEELQKSRQTWYRAATWSANMVSPECAKQIFCEQACKDDLEVGPRADYPQVLEGDTDANRAYVQSWNEGECLVCHNRKSTAQSRTRSNGRYNGKSCERDCGRKYPRCLEERKKSIFLQIYYKSARILHKLGMWLFDVTHYTDDALGEFIHMVSKILAPGL